MSGDAFMEQAASAVALKNLYDSYVAAGFNHEQAMQIVLTLMNALVKASS